MVVIKQTLKNKEAINDDPHIVMCTQYTLRGWGLFVCLQIQDLTNKGNKQIDDMGRNKEKEIMSGP